jgi:hypothetical protein
MYWSYNTKVEELCRYPFSDRSLNENQKPNSQSLFLIIFPITNYNFACGSVWVWNLVSDIKGGTWTEGVWEQGAEENISTEDRWSDESLEKTA